MLISPAYAQDITGMFGSATQFLPLVLIFVVFYFLLIRPQQQKQKEMRSMLVGVEARRPRGDRRRHHRHGAARADGRRQGRQAGGVERDRGGDRAQHPRHGAARDDFQRGAADGGERCASR